MLHSSLRTKSNLTLLLSELVSMPTVSGDNAANRRALEWIKLQLSSTPVHMTDYEHRGVPSLLLTTQPTRTPKIWIVAHMDVVPAPPEMFMPRKKDGVLYGRGSHDMKFAIACAIELLRNLDEQTHLYDFGIMITCDEENGSRDGVVPLVKAGYRGEAVLLPDTGPAWKIESRAKGTQTFFVTAQGTSGHGSRPWTGHNAIEELMDYLIEVKRHFIAEPCGDPIHEHNTINVGRIEGGLTDNSIAEHAQADVNIRITPDTSWDHPKNLLRKVAKQYSGISIRLHHYHKPIVQNLNNPYIKSFLEIAQTTIGHPVEPIIAHGASDANSFIDLGIPVILTRPGGGGAHSSEEGANIDDMLRFYNIMRQFIMHNCRITTDAR